MPSVPKTAHLRKPRHRSLKRTRNRDPMVLTGGEAALAMGGGGEGDVEVESVKCDCCGLTEDCTKGYIARIRERHAGRWICGLCSVAVEEEIRRSKREMSTEEAMDRHKSFRSASPKERVAAMREFLRRGLDVLPRSSTPNSPHGEAGTAGGRRPLTRSESCFPKFVGS